MADYFTQFSTEIGNIKKKERVWLEDFLKPPEDDELEDEEKLKCWMDDRYKPYDEEPEHWPHFEWEFLERNGKTHLWVYGFEHGTGIDFIAHVAQHFLKKFRPKKWFAMEWANTCSKMRSDGFGGGAIFVTAEEVKYMTTMGWMEKTEQEFKEKHGA